MRDRSGSTATWARTLASSRWKRWSPSPRPASAPVADTTAAPAASGLRRRGRVRAGDRPGAANRPATEEAHVAIRYQSQDGREWWVTLEAPGKVLSVAPELEKSGALLPEHQIQIVFTSGEERYAEEYTELSLLEDLSP